MAFLSFLDRERTVAQPGFNRWLVPPAALCIHLCIGMAYGFSVFWLPLSRAIAAQLFGRRVADDAEFADYMQYATLGLIEAVDAFDYRRGVKFNTFATYRIQGAIRNCIVNFSERREQVGLLFRLTK